jgi:hypothetical protein
VFFPGFGWVEFEPTASEAEIVRPERLEGDDVVGNPDDGRDEGFERGSGADDELLLPEEMEGLPPTDPNTAVGTFVARVPWTGLAAGAAGLLAVALVLTVVALRAGVIGWENLGRMGGWVMRRSGPSVPTSVALVYMQFERAARWLGLGATHATTAHERAEAFSQALPQARPGIETITDEYVAEQYSPRPADPATAHKAWQGIRLQVWHDALQSFLLDLFEDDPNPAEPKVKNLRRATRRD